MHLSHFLILDSLLSFIVLAHFSLTLYSSVCLFLIISFFWFSFLSKWVKLYDYIVCLYVLLFNFRTNFWFRKNLRICFLWRTNRPIELSWVLNIREDDGYCPTQRRRSNCQTKTLKLVMGPIGCTAPRRTGWQTVGRSVSWNWTCVIALQVTDPSSRQRGRPTWKIKKEIVTQINVISGHLFQKGQDTKTNWPTDRPS
jgi:hypothetical protein